FSPIDSRRASTSAAVASGPSSTAAGSPGASLAMMKMTTATMASTGSIWTSLERRYLDIGVSLPPLGAAGVRRDDARERQHRLGVLRDRLPRVQERNVAVLQP